MTLFLVDLDSGLFKLILFILFGAIALIGQVIKHYQESAAKKSRRPAPPPPLESSAPGQPMAGNPPPVTPSGDALREIAEQRRRQLAQLAEKRKAMPSGPVKDKTLRKLAEQRRRQLQELHRQRDELQASGSTPDARRTVAPPPPLPPPKPRRSLIDSADSSSTLNTAARMAVRADAPGPHEPVHRHVSDAMPPAEARRAALRLSRSTIRQAFVLKELLDPPISLR
jgi:hypothetical protein